MDIPDFFLVVRISAEDLSDESEPWEEQLPHEIPAATDHTDNEQDGEKDWKSEKKKNQVKTKKWFLITSFNKYNKLENTK